MSFEQQIKEKHAFEDRLQQFLFVASIMTDREIELTLARLADALSSGVSTNRALFNGRVLKTYYDMRRSGAKRHRQLKRMFLTSLPGLPPLPAEGQISFSEYVADGLAKFDLLVPANDMTVEILHEFLARLAP